MEYGAEAHGKIFSQSDDGIFGPIDSKENDKGQNKLKRNNISIGNKHYMYFTHKSIIINTFLLLFVYSCIIIEMYLLTVAVYSYR